MSAPITVAVDVEAKGKAIDVPAAAANAQPVEVSQKSALSIITPAEPVIAGSRGDWTAVWDTKKNKYYFWNKVTNKTTWKNPFPDAEANPATDGQTSATAAIGDIVQATSAAAASVASGSMTKPAAVKGQSSTAPATAADFGGVDPDLAYLDPSLAARAGAPSATFQARFNARTGRFQGDPTINPDRVSDVERAKRQNQFYFDYSNWEKTLGAQQEEANRKRAAGELVPEDEAKRRKPSAKEMAAIKERNKLKKDKRQKGWLLEP